MMTRRCSAIALATLLAGMLLAAGTVAHAGSNHNVFIGDDPANQGRYDPSTVNIKAGDTVIWRNEDDQPHTVTADDGSFDSGDMAPGVSYSRAFNTARNGIGYHCQYHPTMKGTVNVAPRPAPSSTATQTTTTSPTPTHRATSTATATATSSPRPTPSASPSPSPSPTPTPSPSPTPTESESPTPAPSDLTPAPIPGRGGGGLPKSLIAIPVVLALGGVGLLVWRRFLV